MDTLSRADVERSELWIGSVQRYHQCRQEEHRWQWVRYFDRMARLHRQLSESYTARADALSSEDGER